MSELKRPNKYQSTRKAKRLLQGQRYEMAKGLMGRSLTINGQNTKKTNRLKRPKD